MQTFVSTGKAQQAASIYARARKCGNTGIETTTHCWGLSHSNTHSRTPVQAKNSTCRCSQSRAATAT